MDWADEIESILNRLADCAAATERTSGAGYVQSVELEEGGDVGVVKMRFDHEVKARFPSKTQKVRAQF